MQFAGILIKFRADLRLPGNRASRDTRLAEAGNEGTEVINSGHQGAGSLFYFP